MKIDDVVERLYLLLHLVEKEVLQGDSKIAIICGEEFTDNDFRNMNRVVDRIHKYYKSGTRTSYKYIYKNKKYNQLMALQNYYKRKNNKNEKDYKKLAELTEELDKTRKQMKEEKESEYNKKIASAKRKEMEMNRKKELFDKYGFIG